YQCINNESLSSGVCELQSLRVLSFAAGRCCVLLNADWLLQLLWLQGEELQVSSCCNLQPTDNNKHTTVHHCVCRGTLFSLSSAGLVSVYSITDGSLLATVNLPAYLSSVPEEDNDVFCPSSSSFCLLGVSADLSTAVAVTQAHGAVGVDLNHYFRLFPGHLLCATPPTRSPLRPQNLKDQDAVLSSTCSFATHTQAPSSSGSPPPPTRSSWSGFLPHLESQAPSSAQSRAPGGGATITFSVSETSAPSLLVVSEFSALLTFVSPGNRQTTVALWDLESGSVSYHKAEGEAVPVQRCGERQHRLLLKKTGMVQVLFSVSQQDLLSRLMLFGSAATVDAVCHLNNWGLCSIPIHALKAGLKNRQLDTVDFYLKSKENILSLAADQPAASTQSVLELCPALDLLCSAVRESNSEAQSRQFSEQLLNITINFVNTQIRSVLLSVFADEDKGVRRCVDVLDRYVIELRSYMKKYPWPEGGDTSSTDSAAPAQEEASKNEWEELQVEEVICQSILTNQIPRAQAILRRRGHPKWRLSALRMEGLQQVFSCLQRRDLQTANTLLTNMGFDVKKQLHRIGLYTPDKELRDFVVSLCKNPKSQVGTPRHLTPPSPKGKRSPPAHFFPLFRVIQMSQRQTESGVELLEQLVGQRRPDVDGGLWRNLRLDWVSNWDQNSQTAILLSRLQHTELSSCDSAVLWRYLTALHDQRRVVGWIQNQEAAEASLWPELTPEMVNDNTLCSSYLRENILDLLARKGLFVPDELNLNTVPLRDLNCIVELLIVAHDCFSLTCNMEGIVRVLQAARHLSHAYLAPGEHYGLLVRLLTGIGRYNEMTYVFDLLHQNHRFEMLLRKKTDTDRRQTALLDYIKRCLPADSEKHNMVALCFSMRREIGENHEMAAKTQLKIIESQAWVVTPELKSSLLKVLGLLKDAAESFSKDSCVRQATRCVRTAKLIALQLHFLNQGSDVCVINLRPAELLNAVIRLPRCFQVLVVSEAYSYSPDWAEILYQRVILKGDFVYLDEFKELRPLTAGLFEEIFKKLDGAPGSSIAPNVKRLLTHCDDIYSRYRLAYQQNLYDVTKTMLQDATTANYLNDRLAS
uniref:Spatacsin C-terminal domain-containing protein n=1 Tax=Echeneis naucrates TaxID=173247 RepID=A0A665VW24_ECHNA